MLRRILLPALAVAALVAVVGVSNAQAGMFGKGCCEPACCAPACVRLLACAAPKCCEPACCARRCCRERVP